LALCIAVQSNAVYASQSPRSYFPSFSLSSFSLESIKNAFNSDNLKKYAALLAAGAVFYELYRWIMQKSVKKEEPAGLNVNQPPIEQQLSQAGFDVQPAAPVVSQQPEQLPSKPSVTEQQNIQSISTEQSNIPIKVEQPVFPQVAQSPVVSQPPEQRATEHSNIEQISQSNIPLEPKQSTEKEKSLPPQKLIRIHAIEWIKNNFLEMKGVFLEKRQEDAPNFANQYDFVKKESIDVSKTTEWLEALVSYLKEIGSKNNISNQLDSEEVFDIIKRVITDFPFGSNSDRCRKEVFELLEKVVDNNWKTEEPKQVLQFFKRAVDPELEDLKDPILTDEEKKYLQENLPWLSDPLKLEKNQKKYNSQNDIFNVGDPSAQVIGSILFEVILSPQGLEKLNKDDFLKGLLKKAVNVFAGSLASTPGGYYGLKIFMEDADKIKLGEIDWKDLDGFRDYCSTHFGIEFNNKIKDQSKLSRTAFWIVKAGLVVNTGFNMWSADSTCKLLQTLQQNAKRFEKDEALLQAIDISCRRAKIENSQLHERLTSGTP